MSLCMLVEVLKMILPELYTILCHRYWTAEKDRVKKGLKPRLWFALFQCIKKVFVLQGILFAIEVKKTPEQMQSS